MREPRDTGEPVVLLALPQWTPYAKRLAFTLVGLWVALVCWERVLHQPSAIVFQLLTFLDPASVLRGRFLWTVLTYGFFEPTTQWSALWTAFALWVFGSPVERARDGRSLLVSGVFGQLFGAAVALLVAALWPATRGSSVSGAGPACSAWMVLWAWLQGTTPQNFFGLATVSSRQIAAGLGLLSLGSAIFYRSAQGFAAVGGLLGGLAYIAWLTRRGRGGPKDKTPGKPRFVVLEGGAGKRFDVN